MHDWSAAQLCLDLIPSLVCVSCIHEWSVAQLAVTICRARLRRCARQTLGRHCLVLDQALDEVVKARLQKARGVSFFGCGVASDESPPSQDRFAGFRFQITYVYCPMFDDDSLWELAERPPVRRDKYLGDIAHCPGKDGPAVTAVIEKQLRRIGLNLTDIVSGTGDGGGENERMSGVHASLEEIGDGSYVRRRCLGHLAWRAADAGINEMGAWAKQTTSLSTYLHEGITFRRLKSIACQPIATGGLALIREGSQDFLNAFNKAPPSVVEGRPETYAKFLGWTVQRERLIAKCIQKDVADRSLGESGQAAAIAMADPLGTLRRAVQYELLERVLFLFYWGSKNTAISASTSLPQLLAKSLATIGSLAVDDFFLKRFGLVPADIANRGAGLTCGLLF